MEVERRKFLQSAAGALFAGIGRTLGIGVASATAATATTAAVATAGGIAGAYGSGVRAQVFEVIVRQALAGAPWKEICRGPMQVNNISEADIEKEMERRKHKLNSACICDECVPHQPELAPDFCRCKRCRAKRTKRWSKYRDALAAIPHSKKAPWGCQDCIAYGRKVYEEIRQKVNAETNLDIS
jgi:hypothetical protein